MIASVLCSVNASASSKLKRGPDGALLLLESNVLYKKALGESSFSSYEIFSMSGEVVDFTVTPEAVVWWIVDSEGKTVVHAPLSDLTDITDSGLPADSGYSAIISDLEGNIFLGTSSGACTLWRAPHETEIFAEVPFSGGYYTKPIFSIKISHLGTIFALGNWASDVDILKYDIDFYVFGGVGESGFLTPDFCVDADALENIFLITQSGTEALGSFREGYFSAVDVGDIYPAAIEVDGSGELFAIDETSCYRIDHPIQYACYDADSGYPPVDWTEYTSSDPVTILGSETLARTGYTFGGWIDQNLVVHQEDDEITYTEPLLLTPVWTQPLSLTYDGNGETSGTVPVDPGEYSEGDTATVLGNSGNLAKTLYKFMGWNTLASGLGEKYLEGDDYVFGSTDATLYAKWVLKLIADVLGAWLTPILAAVTPAVPFYWSTATPTVDEYVVLSSVFEGRDPKTNRRSDSWQFTIVTRSGIARAHEIELSIFEEIQDYKGTKSGREITSISFIRSADVSDQTTGESILAVEYRINYQGV